MSVVIVGGHDRMVCMYKKICKEHKCKAKIFTQMSANLSGQIGSPDLLILFTNTVSHKMVRTALAEAEKCNACYGIKYLKKIFTVRLITYIYMFRRVTVQAVIFLFEYFLIMEFTILQ